MSSLTLCLYCPMLEALPRLISSPRNPTKCLQVSGGRVTALNYQAMEEEEECRQVGQADSRVLDRRVSMSKGLSAEGWLASCLFARLVNNISSYLEIFSSRLSRSFICHL